MINKKRKVWAFLLFVGLATQSMAQSNTFQNWINSEYNSNSFAGWFIPNGTYHDLPTGNSSRSFRILHNAGINRQTLFFGHNNTSNDATFGISQSSNSGSSWSTSFIVTGKNKVGINTNDPKDYTLNINGTARATEITVSEDTGADFVFKDNYKLPELKEVESYIQKHRRLPQIPSAYEMKKDGVKIGDLQMKLLQKIEELTLYLISQEKKMNRLKTQNEKEIEQLHNIVYQQQEEIEHLKQLIK